MHIEQGAEAMNEGDGADARGSTRPGTGLAQTVLHTTLEGVPRQYWRLDFQSSFCTRFHTRFWDGFRLWPRLWP